MSDDKYDILIRKIDELNEKFDKLLRLMESKENNSKKSEEKHKENEEQMGFENFVFIDNYGSFKCDWVLYLGDDQFKVLETYEGRFNNLKQNWDLKLRNILSTEAIILKNDKHQRFMKISKYKEKFEQAISERWSECGYKYEKETQCTRLMNYNNETFEFFFK